MTKIRGIRMSMKNREHNDYHHHHFNDDNNDDKFYDDNDNADEFSRMTTMAMSYT
jgi:hypothetical protein